LIFFHFLQRARLENRTHLKQFLQQLFNFENTPLERLTYVFCSDEYLLTINQRYLRHNTYTDIVTFSLSDLNKPVIGDIYISIDRIKENAELFRSTYKLELHRVIFHGALHLCSYKDKTKAEQKLMRAREDYYLQQYFVPRDTVSLRNKKMFYPVPPRLK
jgi:rRNA maturation RNase YbeY